MTDLLSKERLGKAPEWRKALNKAVENYQYALSWYEENRDSPSAQQDIEDAEGGIAKLIRQYGVLIVLNLLDEIDEVQGRLAAYDRAAKEDEMSFNDASAFILNNGMANEDRATIAMRAYNHGRAVMLQPPAPTDRIVPVLPVRDEYGFWRHPNRIETPFDEGGASTRIYEAWFAERGMAVDFTYMNQVFCDDCVYGENIEHPALHWNPESPCGDGWLLTAIFDTEEGPCAEWVRYKSSDSDKEAG
ncbi:hypothetical protein OI450_05935 [Pectobacterium cacticida]|uniref:Uncharacterized protein n=1 Tax=Pectobacterium cacticida TaxID=69221 RepID=A0ABZ2G9M3_9GAMM|nr:hypothetical protein [Pectobacterium cacticida]UYX07910.1 hypothetical protein OI450_05935 [Pectobacterium cacticida]